MAEQLNVIVFNFADNDPGVPGADGTFLNRDLGVSAYVPPQDRVPEFVAAFHQLGFNPTVKLIEREA